MMYYVCVRKLNRPLYFQSVNLWWVSIRSTISHFFILAMPALLALFPAFNNFVQAGILSLWLSFSSFCCFSLRLHVLFKGQPPIVGINSQSNSREWRGWLTALDLSSIVNTCNCNPIGTVLRYLLSNLNQYGVDHQAKVLDSKDVFCKTLKDNTLSRFCYWNFMQNV